jgi:hypothetical protein
MKREMLRGTEVTPNAPVGIYPACATKAFVMTYLGEFVARGQAEWDVLENGDIRLRCRTGEMFLLAETTITRIA